MKHIPTYPAEHELYAVFQMMKQRCYNPNAVNYRFYGARGITVCDTWRNDFWQFVADVGKRPKGYSLDRIDNMRGYEPGNVRWASRKEQALNRRRPSFTGKFTDITYQGVTKSVVEWAAELNMHHNTLRERIRRGLSVEQILSTKDMRRKH